MHSPPWPDGPSEWVRRFAPLILQGEVLDLACGNGRHAKFLASLGHAVLALDRDAEALAKAGGTGITTLQHELEVATASSSCWPFGPNRFTAIVVSNYLHRPLFSHILDSLAPDGVLIYETFALGNAQFGKPSNSDFLLKPGELLISMQTQSACPMRIVAFEDGYVERPKPAMVQRICAIKNMSDVHMNRLCPL